MENHLNIKNSLKSFYSLLKFPQVRFSYKHALKFNTGFDK